jgi:hypothetical protein
LHQTYCQNITINTKLTKMDVHWLNYHLILAVEWAHLTP